MNNRMRVETQNLQVINEKGLLAVFICHIKHRSVSSSQLQLQLHSLENSRTTTENMFWIRITIVCMFITLLEAHKECARRIQWKHLIQTLNSMGVAISHDCALDYEEASLCNPSHLANMVAHNAMLLVDIVKKTETMYRENPNPQTFIEALLHTRHTLSKCIRHSDNAENELVATCFSKLEAFLKKKSHSQCAWEIINSKVREFLQRLEKLSDRRRR
ncbi:hypothetical protein G5714_023690 [Onychostoma macrolepis]|uniref:Uncharacterized protein n=1 Tax=Onychostoma macrolepis TaxID=369639 RepID=A0A7J6BLZ0_9TELE|nr:hypothetical protein G5714_023690 [Onychostoma macrolepis]